MANTLTDQYGLVNITRVEVGFFEAIWGKTISYSDGFSIELFRDGRLLSSILTDNDARQARRGDTLLTVNLGLFTLTFNNKLHTRDGYTLSYDAKILLRVLDPRAFAIAYNQSLDPVGTVRDAIHAALVKHVERDLHDAVTAQDLRFTVENHVGMATWVFSPPDQTNVLYRSTEGIAIVQAQELIPYADPKRAAQLEEEHKLRLEQARLDAETALKLAQQEAAAQLAAAALEGQAVADKRKQQIDAALAEKQRQIQAEYDQKKLEADQVLDELRRKKEVLDQRAALEADARQQGHNRNQRWQDAELELDIQARKAQIQEDINLIRKLRESGATEPEIRREYPELADRMGGRNQAGRLLASGEQSTPHSESSTDLAGSSALEAQHTIHGVHHTSADQQTDIFTLSHLGVEVTQVELVSAQMQLIGVMLPRPRAYLVGKLVPGWTGDQQFMPGDMIVQFHDEPVPPITELPEALAAMEQRGKPIKVLILRGEQPKTFYVTIPTLDEGTASQS